MNQSFEDINKKASRKHLYKIWQAAKKDERKHMVILEALEKRDAEVCEQLARQHIKEARERFLDFCKAEGET